MSEHDDNAPVTRSIELEVEVPGTPEQVWDAIATGPGIEAWFVPAEVAGHVGGKISLDMGSGMEEGGAVTAWDPPRRFVAESEWPTESGPAGRLAEEWIVEARAGGSCVVRLVSSLFASGDWDQELEQMREGWQNYLHNLKLSLTHFPGQPCSTVLVSGTARGSLDEVWAALTGALGAGDPGVGDRMASSAPGAPALAGTVKGAVDRGKYHRLRLLRLDEPAPGTAMVLAYSWQGQVYPSVHAYLFGDDAAAVAERDRSAWRAWMDGHFPSPASDA
jgi:uncharacterized protein YndB with AHSA1/START domain